jgi:hypothetical protein
MEEESGAILLFCPGHDTKQLKLSRQAFQIKQVKKTLGI